MPRPVPLELQGRPFVEQARALPARVALEAFFAAAAGFTDDSPARGAFPWVLERVASEIFRGDTLLQVHGFSPGQQMDCVGRAVHQLVREDHLQLSESDRSPDFTRSPQSPFASLPAEDGRPGRDSPWTKAPTAPRRTPGAPTAGR